MPEFEEFPIVWIVFVSGNEAAPSANGQVFNRLSAQVAAMPYAKVILLNPRGRVPFALDCNIVDKRARFDEAQAGNDRFRFFPQFPRARGNNAARGICANIGVNIFKDFAQIPEALD